MSSAGIICPIPQASLHELKVSAQEGQKRLQQAWFPSLVWTNQAEKDYQSKNFMNLKYETLPRVSKVMFPAELKWKGTLKTFLSSKKIIDAKIDVRSNRN